MGLSINLLLESLLRAIEINNEEAVYQISDRVKLTISNLLQHDICSNDIYRNFQKNHGKGDVDMAQVATQEMFEQEEDTQKGRFLTFSLGKETYGIEIRYVTEIIGIQAITEVPELPVYIKGIINLRGKIIPVMDVRLRFKKEPKEYNDRTCVIVVDIRDISVGLIVDSVSEVLTIPEQDIVEPPHLSKGYGNRYIKNIGKVGNDVKLLIDCEKLLTEDDMEQLNEAL